MTETEAFEEVVCDAAQRMLTDTDAGKKLAAWGLKSESNKITVKRIWEKLTELFDRLRAYFKDAAVDSKAAKAFTKLDKNVQQILGDMLVDMSTDAAEKLGTIKAAGMLDKINTTNEGGVRYSLMAFSKDGRRFVDVQADPHIFDGMTVSEMNRMAKSILMEKFAGRVIGRDNRAFVNGDSVNEYLHPSKSIDIDIRKAKLTATGELDNLLDAGVALPNEPDGKDGHVHPDAIDFSYYQTIFKVGNEYFEGIVNIKNIKRGRLLKDVTKIKNITKDIVSSYGDNPKSNFLRDASTDSIRNPDEIVKPKSTTYSDGNPDVRYKRPVSKADFDKDFDYSQLNWAKDNAIIDAKDLAIFERTIKNEIFRGAKPQTANGEYIIDTGRCLMFTDGDFHNPTLSRVIVFATEYESLTADAKEMIRDDAATTGDIQESISFIKESFGDGFISEHSPPVFQTNGWQNRGRKGTAGTGSNPGYRAKSLRERLAEEGLSHLLDDPDDPISRKLAVREDTSASAILKKVDATTATPMQQEKLEAYREQLKKIDTQKEILRSQIERLKDAKGHAKAMLQSNIRKTENRIQILEDQLARMENHKALQSLVEKEWAAAEVRYQESIDQVLQEMREQYGTIPKGEKAARDDSLPVSMDGKSKVSRSARTVKGAAVTTDELAREVDVQVAEGKLSYIPITNDETAKKANAWVEKLGWDAALASWYRDVGAGNAGADITARGAVLLNHAAQAGDKKTWLELLCSGWGAKRALPVADKAS